MNGADDNKHNSSSFSRVKGKNVNRIGIPKVNHCNLVVFYKSKSNKIKIK